VDEPLFFKGLGEIVRTVRIGAPSFVTRAKRRAPQDEADRRPWRERRPLLCVTPGAAIREFPTFQRAASARALSRNSKARNENAPTAKAARRRWTEYGTCAFRNQTINKANLLWLIPAIREFASSSRCKRSLFRWNLPRHRALQFLGACRVLELQFPVREDVMKGAMAHQRGFMEA